MEKESFGTGIGLIVCSGLFYTAERFIAMFQYFTETVPVKLSGSGSYPGEPIMPALTDNFFVVFLLLLGVGLTLFGFLRGTKKEGR